MKDSLACLAEENLIHEGLNKSPFTFILSLLITGLCTALFGFGLIFFARHLDSHFSKAPFLRVTNRQMSLFLWQNPSFMRAFAKNKNGYLPAFEQGERIGLNPEYAEEYAIAPPEVLFYYHTWKRLVASSFFKRHIDAQEFKHFLQQNPQWLPNNWPAAPKAYIAAIASLKPSSELTHLPQEVRQAFIGWKNFFLEGEMINALPIRKKDIEEFLKLHPTYGRTYWLNIFGKTYLKSLNSLDPLQLVPKEEISPFLRVAFYNFTKREQED